MITHDWKELIQELIGQEDLVRIGDVAECIRVRGVGWDEKQLKSYEFPIDYSNFKVDGQKTTLELQQYDIILKSGHISKVYMIDKVPTETFYHYDRDVVIRPNGKMQPEYIYLFLKSQTGQQLMSYFCSACGPATLPPHKVKDLYIPQPTLSESDYRKTFEVESNYRLDMSSYNDLIANWQEEENQSIVSIFNTECLDKVLEKKSELFSEMVRQDIEELRACFKAKAYKATLIMAGSILEAILIDWLNDMSGKNYFEEDFQPEDRKGYKEKATLKDYINAVKYIEYPRWMDGAEMAHDIRDKRNLVHAKLGIYSDDINEETCLMVIDYLERVIKTRQERMYFRYDKRKIENFRRL